MPESLRLDEIDVRLLDELQIDADRTLRELGGLVGLSPSAVQRRVQRYKAAGLTRTVVQIAPDKAPRLTQAVVLLALVNESVEHHRRITETLRAHPAVQQCFLLSGRWDYAVLVSAPSVRELRDTGNQLFKADDNIRRYDTMFVLDSVKDGVSIPAQYLT
ncbi:AsnC family transcriptional regulator [Amycolatopsis antarctica]|uniref:AsnC family transcriptional regulator n=1 Tax=Amycolatopsis antarctica TaxID=1854586 RepID=A0A263CYQ7_9PSEU|nr:Lrp/AsnC family transcriptional regulator [Amycolatopsis antarctica]OZM71241.1 AsnC family transcriptional regulator [Amycolatopsis antarctica]